MAQMCDNDILILVVSDCFIPIVLAITDITLADSSLINLAIYEVVPYISGIIKENREKSETKI